MNQVQPPSPQDMWWNAKLLKAFNPIINAACAPWNASKAQVYFAQRSKGKGHSPQSALIMRNTAVTRMAAASSAAPQLPMAALSSTQPKVSNAPGKGNTIVGNMLSIPSL